MNECCKRSLANENQTLMNSHKPEEWKTQHCWKCHAVIGEIVNGAWVVKE